MQQKLLTEEQLKAALEEGKRSGRRLGRVVIEKGYVTEEKISQALARQLNAPYIDLKHYNTRSEVILKLPETQARRFRALALEDTGMTYRVGMADPTASSDSNFWSDVNKSLAAIVGTVDGRSVIVNPQSGVIVVRALPAELRSVESFLKAMQLIVERQVVLEAKIISVTLNNAYGAGINWAGFRDGSNRAAGGVIRPGTTIGNTGTLSTPTARAPDGTIAADSLFSATLGAASSLAAGVGTPGSVFGLALQTSNFAALLTFLETQGAVNVLSSPRVATINNQKAVLKVGTDDFFVTNVSTTSTTSGTSTTIAPTITLQPFFSGIALDVTPQIDENNNIILHVHPQVSDVIEKKKVIDLGTLGVFTLPLASSNINETDTIVRVQDGNIVAIGGLMRQKTEVNRSQVPGLGDQPGIGDLFSQRANSLTKSELVILLKPTIVHSDRNWQDDLAESRERVRAFDPPAAPAPR